MTPVLRTHPDRQRLCAAVLGVMHDTITGALASRGEALVGLSGGSTPIPVYRALASAQLPWDRVRFLVIDERFVSTDEADSNEGQLRRALAPVGPTLQLIGLRGEAEEPVAAAAAANAVVAALPRPDLLLLGMGEDGHIASLFPQGRGCDAARAPDQALRVMATCPEPLPAGAPHPRLTLTLSAIAGARQCLLLMTGAAKRAVYDRAASDPALPVGDLMRAGMPPLQVHWSP
ncbi:MAG: 6-phosphogluconolactonase [Lysobacterales bacterium]